MSYGIQSKKLKKLVDFYSPFNNGQQLKFISLFKGQQGILRYLQTSSFQGIDSTSLQQRSIWFGTNYPDQTNKPSKLLQILLFPLTNFGMKLQLLFSIIVLIVTIVYNTQYLLFSQLGAIINILVFVIVYIFMLIPQIYQYYDNLHIKSYIFQGCKVKVWRDNQKKQIHNFQLVVGDIVELQPGDKIGADGLIIQGNLSVKQTMSYKQLITQKNKTKQCLRRWASYQQKSKHFQFELQFQLQDDQQQRQLSSPIVLAGSQVINGQGKYVVLCVGKYSRIGYFLQQLYKSAEQRRSDIQIKMNQIVFEISKYLVLALIVFILLFICKTIAFIIIQNTFTNQNWLKIIQDFVYGITIILLGMPISHIIGITIGSYYLKLQMYKIDEIWYKYSKDCGTMKQISSIVFDRIQQIDKISLIKWWNLQNIDILQQNNNNNNNNNSNKNSNKSIKNIKIYKDINPKYENMLIQSLMCQDFVPQEVGLKINSFFIGTNQRFISYLESALQEFANRLHSVRKSIPKQQQLQSEIQIIDSQNSSSSKQSDIVQKQVQSNKKQVQIIYLKGSSQSLIDQCTHIMQKHNGKIIQITQKLRKQILQTIQKMNAMQQLSLITGYIQVHPNHPKFRQTGYKLVMLSLIGYKQNHNNQQFESLANLKKMGISITLVSSRQHAQTVATSKQLGFLSMDRPSIQLKGYNFNQVVGGIICKSCKKSICICTKQQKHSLALKNQDQFNRIYKHLNIISQANSIDKLALSIGLANSNQKSCIFGTNISDIPAIRKSTISSTVYSQMQDNYIQSAAQLILPNNKLVTIQKLINWSKLYHQFIRKYLVFVLTPSFVAFSCSFVSYLLFNNFCFNLLQIIWVTIVVCGLFGSTFGFVTSNSEIGNNIIQQNNNSSNSNNYNSNTNNDNSNRNNKNEQIIDRISYRQISSQVITQFLIIILILTIGPNFIPQDHDQIDQIIAQNWSSKYNTQSKQTICTGIYQSIFTNKQQYYTKTLQTYNIHSRHFTFIFNLFTIMQIFNYFNCRNLYHQNSINFIHGISVKMVVVIIIAIVLHVLVILYGDNVFGLYPGGLTIKQWAICLGLSLIVIIVGLVIRQLPYDYQHEQLNYKIWPNRCYNLAVMATIPRESYQDFQIDQELEIKRMAKLNQ